MKSQPSVSGVFNCNKGPLLEAVAEINDSDEEGCITPGTQKLSLLIGGLEDDSQKQSLPIGPLEDHSQKLSLPNGLLDRATFKAKLYQGNQRFICPICKKFRAGTYTEYIRHSRVHTAEKPFGCPFCLYKTNWKHGIEKHIKSRHLKLTPGAPEKRGGGPRNQN